MSVKSLPQSPEFPASLLTSPIILAAQMAQHTPQQLQDISLDCRRMSLSPQLSASAKRNSSFSSDSLSIGSSKSPKKHLPYQNITNLTLELVKPKNIPQQSITSTIEDSPQLLATSVGAEIGNQLVPSISNISLLSLNQYNSPTIDTSNMSFNDDNNATSSRLNNLAQKHLNIQRGPSNLQPIQQHGAQFTIGSRKSSFHSPTLQGTQFFNSQSRPIIRRPSSYQQYSSKQPIQIRQKRGSNNSESVLIEPDSPPLDPISLAGSPSNFLLSHSSPPNSYKSSSGMPSVPFPLAKYNCNGTNSRPNSNRQSLPYINTFQEQQMTSQSTQVTQVSQLKLLINKYTDDTNNKNSAINNNDNDDNNLQILINPSIPLKRDNSIVDSIGGRSPELAPISTSLPPMTPLVLSLPPELASRSNSTIMIDDNDIDTNFGDLHNNAGNLNNANNNNNNSSSSNRTNSNSRINNNSGTINNNNTNNTTNNVTNNTTNNVTNNTTNNVTNNTTPNNTNNNSTVANDNDCIFEQNFDD